MAAINFYANLRTGANDLIGHTLGSGIGFYGNDFGVSVPVNSQQSTTWTTNADGTSKGVQLNNTAMSTPGSLVTPISAGTVSINGGAAKNLDRLPNYLCPLNIRFTHSEPVKVQNCKLRIFDRNNISNHASGVQTYVYEARHPSNSEDIGSLNQRGIDTHAWYSFAPLTTMTDMTFTRSPGMSGTNTNSADTNPLLGYLSQEGPLHASSRHDWYVALSSEPESIGSKTNYGLYFSLEYL